MDNSNSHQSQELGVESLYSLISEELEKEKAAGAERMKSLEGELNKERTAGAERVKALEGELTNVKKERDALAKECELALLNSHHLQKELEHHFSESCGRDALLKTYQDQQKRMKKVISMLMSKK